MLLYIMLACLMLLTALFNDVCLHNSFFPLTFANSFCFVALSLIIDTACLFQILFCIMHSSFNLLVFLILCFTPFYYERAMCSLEK